MRAYQPQPSGHTTQDLSRPHSLLTHQHQQQFMHQQRYSHRRLTKRSHSSTPYNSDAARPGWERAPISGGPAAAYYPSTTTTTTHTASDGSPTSTTPSSDRYYSRETSIDSAHADKSAH